MVTKTAPGKQTAAEGRTNMKQRKEEPVRARSASDDEDIPSRGQFAGMSIEDLQQLHLNEVGRPTESTDRTYLEWKLRQVRGGKVRVGPRSLREGMPDKKMIPIRLEEEELESLDAAWQVAGMHTRMQFIREAFCAGLRSMRRSVKGDDAKAAISRALAAFER